MEDLSLSHEVVEAQLSAAPKHQPFKRCGCCGQAYTRRRWLQLKSGGVQPGEEPLQYRQCFCGSTLAVPVADEALSHGLEGVTVVDLSSRFPRGWGGVR